MVSSSCIKKPSAIPLVSVIVPNYNCVRYLAARMDSILNQTYTDYELILLDDASTDRSEEILAKYQTDSHVSHIVFNEKNTGSPFAQWLKGITLCTGKYIWIAEADDLADPDFLRTCVTLAEKYPDTSICYVGSYLIDAGGHIRHRDPNHWGKRSKKDFACFDGKRFAEYDLYWKNYIINASGVLFRREYAQRLLDSPFASMRYCGDWLFWFEMSIQGCVVEVYKSLNYFRQHEQKATVASHQSGNGVREDIMVVRMMEAWLSSKLSEYKKRLRHGLLYKKIKKQSIDPSQKQKLYTYLFDTLRSDVSDYYLERRNKYLHWLLPSLITVKRERL